MEEKTDIIIVGSGAAGLFCALFLPADKKITIITKESAKDSDSFLAQGGICVLKSERDYDSYYEDTMRAGHYENRAESVDIMLRSSKHVIDKLVEFGVEFEKEGNNLRYTREGGHSEYRILFHKDITGQEITGKLLAQVKKRKNITIYEHTAMLDLITAEDCNPHTVAQGGGHHPSQDTPAPGGNSCRGVVLRTGDGQIKLCEADYTILACGGIGGLYRHSTNFKHITGDAIAIALNHGIRLENIDYVQIHPTTLYSKEPGRRFLISESVRGEGAFLLDKDKKRFVDELLPRDQLTKKVWKQMEKDGTDFVWLSMIAIPKEAIISHFPNIYKRCLKEGYDCTREPIPVVPAQHYFMGGIWVDSNSHTSLGRLYAIGETSCNGVHGKNRLASNSLLESLVFAERAAVHIGTHYKKATGGASPSIQNAAVISGIKAGCTNYGQLMEHYHKLVRSEIEKQSNAAKI